MEHSQQQKGMSLDEFIHRKVQPVKMIVALLNREMELNAESQIMFGRNEVDNIITTLEIFIEEYERVTSVRSARQTQQRQRSAQGPNLIEEGAHPHGHQQMALQKKPAIKAVA